MIAPIDVADEIEGCVCVEEVDVRHSLAVVLLERPDALDRLPHRVEAVDRALLVRVLAVTHDLHARHCHRQLLGQ